MEVRKQIGLNIGRFYMILLGMLAIVVAGCSDDMPEPAPQPTPKPWTTVIGALHIGCPADAHEDEIEVEMNFPEGNTALLTYVSDVLLPCDDMYDYLIAGKIGQLTIEDYCGVYGGEVIKADRYCRSLGYDEVVMSDEVEYVLGGAKVKCVATSTPNVIKVQYHLDENKSFKKYRTTCLYFFDGGNWFELVLVQSPSDIQQTE